MGKGKDSECRDLRGPEPLRNGTHAFQEFSRIGSFLAGRVESGHLSPVGSLLAGRVGSPFTGRITSRGSGRVGSE